MKAFKGGYANHQWAVVPCGLYCRERDYLMQKDDLADLRQDWRGGPDNLSNTLLHIAAKIWIDLDALIEATEMALLIHDPGGFAKIDWPASVAMAREKAERNRLWHVWDAEVHPNKRAAALLRGKREILTSSYFPPPSSVC